MKYNIGDKFLDRKDGSILEVVGYIEETDWRLEGYDITCDGVSWPYGVSDLYIDKNCDKIKG